MTNQDLTHEGALVQPYRDTFGIGQRKIARIRMEMAMREMAECHVEAFGLQYENPDWRAMRRRMFAQARADHDRAKAILSGVFS